MSKTLQFILLIGILLLTSCDASANSVTVPSAAILPTQVTVLPTETATSTPTATPLPTATSTPSPTITPSPSATPSPKPTATATPTATREPFATATPMATRMTTETAFRLDTLDSFGLSLAWSPDGAYIYVGTKDQGVFAFNAHTQEQLYQSGGEGVHAQALAINPAGTMLAVGMGNDGSIRLVAAATGDLITTIWPAHEEWPQVLAFSPDGRLLASGGDDGQIFIWDSFTGELIKALYQGDYWVWGMAFSPDGQTLVVGFDVASTFRVWDTETWELQNTFSGDFAADLAFSPDGSKIATAGGGQHEANLWDITTGEHLLNFADAPGWVWAVAYDPQERFVASGGIGEVIILWDLITGEPMLELYMGGDFIQALAFNPDGTVLASAGGEVWLWDLSEP